MAEYNTGEVGGIKEANLLDESSDIFSAQQMNDSVALGLVNSQYERYRIWRYRNHDLRWNTDDALYVGWMPQRFWEGTRVPRSSLGVPITFDQSEAAAPVIMNALFGDVEWFEVDPLGDTTVAEARQQKERLMYLLENPQGKFGSTARNEIRLAVKQLLVYGNGTVNVDHDGTTGDPVIEWVDLRDLYVDPGLATPLLDDSKLGVVHRDFMTLDELEALRGTPGIKLPPKPLLRLMASQRPADTADLTKQNQEAYRNVIYRPGYDDSTDFGPGRQLEVLRYVSDSRIIWVLQRRWVMYNETNPYRFITYCGAPCYIMPGRFYGMGIADALEGNQKYAQAILNGHLDELSLQLNPPRARNRNAMTQGSSVLRPGQVWELNNPKEDMIFYPPSGATKDGWQEIQFLEASSEKRTGVTNMITNGMPLRSNASRTATGIQAQTAGPTTRLQAIVEHIEDYMIVPMLYKLIAIDALHSQAGDSSLRGMTASGSYTQVDPASLKRPVKFRIKASSRMLTQSKLQFIAPFLSQYLMNGAFLSQLAKSGQTVDFGEFFNLIQDATGTRASYKLVRPLTPQEQQQMSTPPPQEVLRQQTAKANNDNRIQIAQIKAQSEKDRAAAEAAKGNEAQALELLRIFTEKDQSLGLAPGQSGEGTPGAPEGPSPGVGGMLSGA